MHHGIGHMIRGGRHPPPPPPYQERTTSSEGQDHPPHTGTTVNVRTVRIATTAKAKLFDFPISFFEYLKIHLTYNAESSYLAAWAPANKAWSHSQGNIAVMDS